MSRGALPSDRLKYELLKSFKKHGLQNYHRLNKFFTLILTDTLVVAFKKHYMI